ncbi:peptidoglycan hydrolase-like protein with peptidoglycan-binding domain [Catenulispora sp. GP43]
MRRWLSVALGAVAVSAVAVTAVTMLRFKPAAVPQARSAPPQTATIARTTLSTTVTLQGTLGYGTSTPFTGRKAGTVTWLPTVGTVVGQGQTLYSVDALPVALFLGTTPLYRAIDDKAAPGPDIAEVNANLRSLGYGFVPAGDAYTPGTENALKKWQQSKGLAANGTLAIGDLVVLPAPVRVASLDTQLGAPAAADLLGLSSTTKHVTVTVDPRQVDTSVLTRGLKVSLTLPDGKQATGTISALSSPGAAAPAGSSGSSGGGGGGGGGASGPSMTVDVADQSALSGMDSGSVGITVTTGSVDNVLAVPVEALVAVQGGGYAVQEVTGDGQTSILVGVQTGLFANGLVQISGQGIAEGLKVVTVS